MAFNNRQEPTEFVGEMPEDYEDEEYYGEEEEGYADDEGMEDYDEEDEDEGPAPSKGGGAKKDWVKTALMGIAALLFLGGGGYYAATIFAPDVVNDLVNNLPFVSQGGGEGDQAANPDGAPPPDGAAPPPADPTASSDVAPVPPPPPKPVPKPIAPAPVKPKPMPKPTAAEFATEGVPPGMELPKPKNVKQKASPWSRPAGAAKAPTRWAQMTLAQKRAHLAWMRKVAARNAAAGKPAPRWTRARYQSAWSARKSRWNARSRYARAYQPRTGWHTRYRAASYPRRSGWHTRYYGQQPYSIGTRWLPGNAAYIPWGGGAGYHGYRPAVHRWAPAPAYRPAYAAPRGRYGVQVGSFADTGNAAALVSQLRSQGIPAYMGRGYGVNRVYVGNYGNRAHANSAMRNLRNQGIPAAVTPH